MKRDIKTLNDELLNMINGGVLTEEILTLIPEAVKVFKENGYETIRIKDKELKERNGFLRCLLNGLMTISISNNTANIEAMIKELSNITN